MIKNSYLLNYMMMSLKSFPCYLIFFLLLFFFLIHCRDKEKNIIDDNKFISVYSNLYIINEMNIERKYRLALINDFLKQHDLHVQDIKNTVDYYNEHPVKWLEIVGKMSGEIGALKPRGE